MKVSRKKNISLFLFILVFIMGVSSISVGFLWFIPTYIEVWVWVALIICFGSVFLYYWKSEHGGFLPAISNIWQSYRTYQIIKNERKKEREAIRREAYEDEMGRIRAQRKAGIYREPQPQIFDESVRLKEKLNKQKQKKKSGYWGRFRDID